MATDPGDLVLDPTCGSGTTATVAEQWGRRWITIDTSRVALALARTRIMAARYPYYLLADSPEGRAKESEVTGKPPVLRADPRRHPPGLRLRARAAHHAEIDRQQRRDRRDLGGVSGEAGAAARELNAALQQELGGMGNPARGWSDDWPAAAKKAHAAWWESRIARQKEIDASIAKNADVEMLYDRPYEDNSRVRVAGPFTVESLSPHRVVPADEESCSTRFSARRGQAPPRRSSSRRRPTSPRWCWRTCAPPASSRSDKRDAIKFTSLQPWPGEWIRRRRHAS